MAAITGIKSMIDFATPSGDPAKCQALLDALPDPDAATGMGAGRGATQGVPGFLDEIGHGALVQLRVELIALKAALT